jgi:glycosyltransferase involved in cell wall biosynthesis
MLEQPRILFLYTELAGYTLACFSALTARGAEVHAVRLPVNIEAPFQLEAQASVFLYERKSFDKNSLLKFVQKLKPAEIIVSGWTDDAYLHVCRNYKTAEKVLLLDNQWTGSVKQVIASLAFKVFLLRHFQHIWVAGKRQALYAAHLGFKPGQIHQGFYSCDFQKYDAYFQKGLPKKVNHFPRRFIYAGRYYDFKGVQDLWTAFKELQQEHDSGWELWCLGTGTIEPIEFKGIRHLGFVQPEEMGDVIQHTGVFVLPSHFEPWGVVVHEYAVAGFPLICSSACGAADLFLQPGKNGYVYQSGNVEELKKLLRKISLLSDAELIYMGELSHTLAASITPEKWADTVLKMQHK